MKVCSHWGLLNSASISLSSTTLAPFPAQTHLLRQTNTHSRPCFPPAVTSSFVRSTYSTYPHHQSVANRLTWRTPLQHRAAFKVPQRDVFVYVNGGRETGVAPANGGNAEKNAMKSLMKFLAANIHAVNHPSDNKPAPTVRTQSASPIHFCHSSFPARSGNSDQQQHGPELPGWHVIPRVDDK